jgi:hypothetical protein
MLPTPAAQTTLGSCGFFFANWWILRQESQISKVQAILKIRSLLGLINPPYPALNLLYSVFNKSWNETPCIPNNSRLVLGVRFNFYRA